LTAFLLHINAGLHPLYNIK